MIQEALDRERFSEQEWDTYRRARLSEVLEIARTRVPHYRDYWAGKNEEAAKRLESWPCLSKDTLRASPTRLLAEGVLRKRLSQVNTSGTTGKPLTLWRSRRLNIAWHALFEARWRSWYGVSRKDRWAILGGQLVVPFERQRPPFWVWNAGMRQLYCSAYHLNERTVPDYLRAWKRYELQYVLGYTSALATVARVAKKLNTSVPPLRVMLTNAEPISPEQRALIESVFQCPVRETYGMAEVVAGAGECESGRLHYWPDASILEVRDDEGQIQPSGEGELIATSLLNHEMPLIRYRVGDRVRLGGQFSWCSCGRRLPVIESIEGRMDDLIVTPDQRVIGRLDPVFKGSFDLEAAQVIQDGPASLVVRYVSQTDSPTELEREIAVALRNRVGDMQIRFDSVSAIPAGPNGKFRAVINTWASPGTD